MRPFLSLAALGLCLVLRSGPVRAADEIPDVTSLIPDATASSLIKTFGLTMDHRSYEPATPLGTSPGIDLSVEVTLAKPPADLGTAMNAIAAAQSGDPTAQTESASSPIPILPSVKLHLHKGFGQVLDIGISALPPLPSLPMIGGSYMVGGDIKVVVFNPEEGLTWALRASYNLNSIVFTMDGQQLNVATNTVMPQLLVSRRMEFADPYLGVGLPYTWGSMSVVMELPEQPAPAPSLGSVTVAKDGSGYALTAFGGVSLKVPRMGLRLTIEGAYNTAGVDYLGTKVGFTF